MYEEGDANRLIHMPWPSCGVSVPDMGVRCCAA